MYAALATIVIAILQPIIEIIRAYKVTATDAVPSPNRERWAARVRKFKSRIRP